MRWMVLLLVILGCAGAQEETFTIAAAANLRPALTEITAAFTAATGLATEVVYASSGKLTAQLKAGAPYDVFLSADERYPAELMKAGLADEAMPYARGRLALWSASADIPVYPDSLASPRIRAIALANPATAPYGQTARAYLESRNTPDEVTAKLVYGESVGQANQFVRSGAAEVGITALSSLPQDAGFRILPLEEAPLTVQAAVLLTAGENAPVGQHFLEFLSGAEGRAILRKYGYLEP